MGIRYNKINDKHQREIVLLKSFPCKYGKCSFCNYIEDNSTDENLINKTNKKVLENITGEYGVLEVINSGSVFELPDDTLKEIKRIVKEKNIHTLYFEIYYGYINLLSKIREYFSGIEIRFRMGLETFDDNFRKNIYNKNFSLNEEILKKLSTELYSVCLLVCTKGQTKEMIDNDIELGLKYFKNITINIFIDNGTVVKRDDELVKWFVKKYSYLTDDDRVELLIDNKDLGVFEQ
ncbi:MAG: radical SAM protein [Fusobacterium perfoetens]|uniref:radical SAM protein n=1 Tax=Fusobacterium perfoetens TaxID=852 RepID=UPI0023F0A7B5|nr:radical SAM protein [Fusobacterium perfoetens]MCI6152096.1 radical SAM protein [Fusobacterium perfoetens]MDY3238013.1 radical SAM protein [Fusobacterium perfoetens]